MTKIKICGITRQEDALLCADEEADFVGFIFVPSTPRFIEPEKAAAIANKLKEREKRPKIVGVFRDTSKEYIREIQTLVGFDLAQLHGNETNDDLRDLGIAAIKTLRVSEQLPDTGGSTNAAWLLFDTFDERRIGGTGRRFDWSLLKSYERAKPFFLSGGISPDNVAAAISLVRPDAIDLSSGVESEPGIKDHDKVRRLFERVRRG
jgi:phosphoribosylanthranilate isomerase